MQIEVKLTQYTSMQYALVVVVVVVLVDEPLVVVGVVETVAETCAHIHRAIRIGS